MMFPSWSTTTRSTISFNRRDRARHPTLGKRDPGSKALGETERQYMYLSALTTHLIRWIATQQDAGSMCAELSRRFDQNVTGYQQKL